MTARNLQKSLRIITNVCLAKFIKRTKMRAVHFPVLKITHDRSVKHLLVKSRFRRVLALW